MKAWVKLSEYSIAAFIAAWVLFLGSAVTGATLTRSGTVFAQLSIIFAILGLILLPMAMATAIGRKIVAVAGDG